jgi:hypothetical protein
MYVDFLIGDLEYFIFTNREKMNKLLETNEPPSYEKSIEILDKFVTGLFKTYQLMNHLDEIEDYERIRNIFIVSSESLAWILFTLPSISEQIPIFKEELSIRGENILDVIGKNLIQIEMFIDNPKSSKDLNYEIKKEINEIYMSISSIANRLKKGFLEN